MSTAPRPLILTGNTVDVDPLAEFAPIEVPASKLREGMVILDDMNTAVAVTDHRCKTVRNSGCSTWMLVDLENGGWLTTGFHTNRLVTVAAA